MRENLRVSIDEDLVAVGMDGNLGAQKRSGYRLEGLPPNDKVGSAHIEAHRVVLLIAVDELAIVLLLPFDELNFREQVVDLPFLIYGLILVNLGLQFLYPLDLY